MLNVFGNFGVSLELKKQQNCFKFKWPWFILMSGIGPLGGNAKYFALKTILYGTCIVEQ